MRLVEGESDDLANNEDKLIKWPEIIFVTAFWSWEDAGPQQKVHDAPYPN